MSLATPSRFASLHDAISGHVIEPGDARWPEATQAFNAAIVQTPAVVVMPADVADVVHAVRYAAAHDMQVAPQRTGHNAGPLGDLRDVLLLRTDLLRSVEIDPIARVARVGSGAKWDDLVPRAGALGLAGPHGTTGDVSVAGYALGGGVGWYGRKHGLASSAIVAIELVTADGRVRRVDADHDPDLFWALRGGGGNFGVVTALEIQLLPYETVHAGAMFFPFERAREVLQAWLEWTRHVPDEVTSVGRLLQFPPAPTVPEPIRGKSFAAFDAVLLVDDDRAAELLAPLRALGPVMDTFARVPATAVADLHGDPKDPMPSASGAVMLGELTPEAIDRFVDAAGPGSGSQLVVAEIRHLGGALSRGTAGDGALGTFDAEYFAFGVGGIFGPGMAEIHHAALGRIEAALEPWDTGRAYLNFSERPTDPSRFFSREALQRLRVIKGVVDPENRFRANHPIAAA